MKPTINQHRIMNPLRFSLALLLGACLFQGCAASGRHPAPANPDEARARFEVVRAKFNADKIRTLNQVMKLTVAEADKFWPIYRQYEQDLAAVGDRKLSLVRRFMADYRAARLDDRNSQAMADQWLQNVQERLDLWKKYHQQISETVSPTRAAQFLQVENQMAILLDLNLAWELPMVGEKPSEARTKATQNQP